MASISSSTFNVKDMLKLREREENKKINKKKEIKKGKVHVKNTILKHISVNKYSSILQDLAFQ